MMNRYMVIAALLAATNQSKVVASLEHSSSNNLKADLQNMISEMDTVAEP